MRRPRTLLRRLGAGAAVLTAAGLAAQHVGGRAFTRLVRDDVRVLQREVSAGDAPIVVEEMLVGLPEPVQRYLRLSGVIGRPFVRTVHLRQTGRMLLVRGLPWVPLKAEQWHTVQPRGFVWDATLHVGPVPLVRARDMYREGRGHMLIKAASTFTVANATGEEVDQGEMMRYLNEMMWFPSAFLEENLSFQGVDSTSARVTLTEHGRRVTPPPSLRSRRQAHRVRRPTVRSGRRACHLVRPRPRVRRARGTPAFDSMQGSVEAGPRGPGVHRRDGHRAAAQLLTHEPATDQDNA